MTPRETAEALLCVHNNKNNQDGRRALVLFSFLVKNYPGYCRSRINGRQYHNKGKYKPKKEWMPTKLSNPFISFPLKILAVKNRLFVIYSGKSQLVKILQKNFTNRKPVIWNYLKQLIKMPYYSIRQINESLSMEYAKRENDYTSLKGK